MKMDYEKEGSEFGLASGGLQVNFLLKIRGIARSSHMRLLLFLDWYLPLVTGIHQWSSLECWHVDIFLHKCYNPQFNGGAGINIMNGLSCLLNISRVLQVSCMVCHCG